MASVAQYRDSAGNLLTYDQAAASLYAAGFASSSIPLLLAHGTDYYRNSPAQLAARDAEAQPIASLAGGEYEQIYDSDGQYGGGYQTVLVGQYTVRNWLYDQNADPNEHAALREGEQWTWQNQDSSGDQPMLNRWVLSGPFALRQDYLEQFQPHNSGNFLGSGLSWADWRDGFEFVGSVLISAAIAGGDIPISGGEAAAPGAADAGADAAVQLAGPGAELGPVDLNASAAVDLGSDVVQLGGPGLEAPDPIASTAVDSSATAPAGSGASALTTVQQAVGAAGTLRRIVSLVNPPRAPAPVTRPPGAAAPRAPGPAAIPQAPIGIQAAPASSSQAFSVLAALIPIAIAAFS